MDELVVPAALVRNRKRDQEANLDGAVWLMGHMAEHIGVRDLGQLDVLDFGCGVRFTQAIVNRGVPIKRYVGVDVSQDVINFLRSSVTDPRCEYFHLDANNELYNPTGQPLSELTVPEIEGQQFDLICLFSVFTHLAPADYTTMLRLLRRFIKPEGRLFYTLFINELTDGGHGYIDRYTERLADTLTAASDDPRLKEAILARGVEPPDFEDVDPSMPLRVAMYSRRHALELIDGTGWTVLEVAPPDVHLQHHIVCEPSNAG
jgi:SAM-dependent methyltransferase